MTRDQLCERVTEAISAFAFEGTLNSYKSYGNGHINDTFLVEFDLPIGDSRRYILQRMNHEIFQKPTKLMANIAAVTKFVRKKVKERGGDPLREGMTIVRTKTGSFCYVDSIGSYWRCYVFIENGLSLEQVETPHDFYQSGLAFGQFQALLHDFEADTLDETIEKFHDTPDRLRKFEAAVQADTHGRVALVQEEIAFVRARADFANTLMNAYKDGSLPLRVTHNDTKLNNVMLDTDTREPLCVIDLDTVMPGFSVNDFGDSIRFGASTAVEDEQDLSKVNLDLDLFDCYTDGFLTGCGGNLTDTELDLLPTGAKMMTFECGTRFLTDYLEGDHYFRTHREGHNLDRARTQFKLVADMEAKWDDMQTIIQKYR